MKTGLVLMILWRIDCASRTRRGPYFTRSDRAGLKASRRRRYHRGVLAGVTIDLGGPGLASRA